jgi:hypothetical protein
MSAAIDLHQHAFLGKARATTTMPGRTPLRFCQQVRSVQNAMPAGSRELDPLSLCEQVSQVLWVAASVGRLSQLNHSLAHLGLNRMPGLASSVPMDDGGCPLLAIGSQNPLHLSC